MSFFSPPISVFPSLSLVQVGKFFHRQYLWSFDFLPIFSYRLGGFSSIGPLSGFPPQFPNGLRSFLPTTWPFEIYQLSYKTRMFSVVSRFSSPVSLIGLRGFSPGFHLRFLFKVLFEIPLQQISHSAEIASEEGGNCNNVTFGVEVMWQLLTIASSHPVWLLSPSVSPYLRHWVGSTFPPHLRH